LQYALGYSRLQLTIGTSENRNKNTDYPSTAFEKNNCFTLISSSNKKVCGIIGLLNNKISKLNRFDGPIALAELETTALLHNVFAVPSMSPLPVYPAVERDMAVIVDNTVTHQDILNEIKKNAPLELTNIRLFDIYKAKELGSNRKSMAYRLRYSSKERTLTDEQVNQLHDNIQEGVSRGLNAEIRKG
jgi:phenylalanyl-tRNA synthetase beta chain